MTTRPEPDAEGFLGTRYTLIGPLGAGGMGEVWKVYDPVLKRTLALKAAHPRLLSQPALLARFVEEAQVQAQLQHPNLLPVHELTVLPDGRPCFAMELISGESFDVLIGRVHAACAPIPGAASGGGWQATADGWTLRRLVGALAQACRAVGYAHAKGVIHRDLKPQNLMAGAFGELYVVDWGLAKVQDRPERWEILPPHPPEGRRSTVGTLRVDGTLQPGSPPSGDTLLLGEPRRAGGAQGGETLQAKDTLRAGDTLRAESDGADLLADLTDLIVTDRSADLRFATRAGSVAGTPPYMPPEQAAGELARIGARSDVYALGAVLYEVLAGAPPWDGAERDPWALVARIRQGPPPALRTAARLPIPEDLDAIVHRAMQRDPAARYADGNALADALEAWLDGAQRREKALAILATAEGLAPQAAALRAEAAARRAEAASQLAAVPGWAPEADKAGAWAAEDRAVQLEQMAGLLEVQREQRLQSALMESPDLPEAHAALALLYLARHAAAEADRDPAAARAEVLLETHAARLPAGHPARQRCMDWLRGEGVFDLEAIPPDAEFRLERFTLHNRRLIAGTAGSGRMPIRGLTLPIGSWRLRLTAHGRRETLYPFRIGRGEALSPTDPAGRPAPVRLLPDAPARAGAPDPACPDGVHVPAGWFLAGGDPAAGGSPVTGRRVWVDDFIISRFPVTNIEYIGFLDDLIRQGREADALRCAPRQKSGATDGLGALIYGFDPDRAGGAFFLQADAEGDTWEPGWPALMVDLEGALAFAAWVAARTGEPWRLPEELEWEKAARGADGRAFPWGDGFDPGWCCMRASRPDRALPADVRAFPVDESPYGVRGMAGNMRDWTQTVFTRAGATADGERLTVASPADVRAAIAADRTFTFRGGSWYDGPASVRLAGRGDGPASLRSFYLGFRLARSVF